MRTRTKRLLWVVGAIVAALVAVPIVVLAPYALRVRRFAADPGAGYHADFYLYVAPQARREARAGRPVTLLVQPNNSGTNSDDPGVHRRDAWWTGFGRKPIADRLGVALLVPAFVRPAEDWRIYTHALDRDVLTTTRRDLARLDLQLLAMVERARGALSADGLPSDPRILIQGFSASGMFANRFAALHPERVLAVAAGSPGGWPIAPAARWRGEALPYPIGVADLEELTGRRFDEAAYRAMPQLLVLGALDDNDSVDFRDGWDEQPAAQVDRLFGKDPQARWGVAEQIYREAGAQARFLRVAGIGHERKRLQEHTTRFFADVLDGS